MNEKIFGLNIDPLSTLFLYHNMDFKALMSYGFMFFEKNSKWSKKIDSLGEPSEDQRLIP